MTETVYKPVAKNDSDLSGVSKLFDAYLKDKAIDRKQITIRDLMILDKLCTETVKVKDALTEQSKQRLSAIYTNVRQSITDIEKLSVDDSVRFLDEMHAYDNLINRWSSSIQTLLKSHVAKKGK